MQVANAPFGRYRESMRRDDLDSERRERLVPLPRWSGASALIPPLTPERLDLGRDDAVLWKAHELIERLDGLVQHLPEARLTTRTFERREAVRSSRIEGTRAEESDLLRYEATGDEAGRSPDVAVTLNYVDALKHGIRVVAPRGREGLTRGLISELHARLMAGVEEYPDTPGEVRSVQVWVGGRTIYEATLVPPPPEAVPAALDDLVARLTGRPSPERPYEVSIVMRMAIAHAQFEAIHPFRDGNGRVGRLIPPLMLVAEGSQPVYLAGALMRARGDYNRLLAGVQLRGEWAPWVAFFAECVIDGCSESIRLAKELLALREGWLGRLSRVRSHATARSLADELLGQPVVTAPLMARRLGVSYRVANGAVQTLVQRGILTQRGDQRRNRVFVASEVIEIIDRPPPDRFA